MESEKTPADPRTYHANGQGLSEECSLSLFTHKYPVVGLHNCLLLPIFVRKRCIKAASSFVKELQRGFLLLSRKRHAEVGGEAAELDAWGGNEQVGEIDKFICGLRKNGDAAAKIRQRKYAICFNLDQNIFARAAIPQVISILCAYALIMAAKANGDAINLLIFRLRVIRVMHIDNLITFSSDSHNAPCR